MLLVTLFEGVSHHHWKLLVSAKTWNSGSPSKYDEGNGPPFYFSPQSQNSKWQRLLTHLDDLLNHKSTSVPPGEPVPNTLPEDPTVDMETMVVMDMEETSDHESRRGPQHQLEIDHPDHRSPLSGVPF
ncbi:hypothetical protein F5141DRAFT_1062547 [Pisolithus sp. B1]|nr:hypothetical protein F5141DRAFT_1062547 [Pisolithus sp. B1]